MKKILILIMILVLSGCTPGNNNDKETCETGYIQSEEGCVPEITCADNETLIEDECVEIATLTLRSAYEIENKTTSFDIEKDTLDIFDLSTDEDTPYVDILDFYEMMDPVFIDTVVTKEDAVTRFEIEVTNEDESESVTLRLEFNHVENTVWFNDPAFMDYIGILGDDFQNYVTGVEMIDSTYTEGNTELLIDLDDYGFDILEEDGRIYLSFHLANLFVAGNYYSAYIDKDTVYILDQFYNDPTVFTSFTQPTGLNQEQLTKNTYEFTLLVMDHFYGLRDFKNIDSFRTIFEEKEMDKITSIADFDLALFNVIMGLDDIHTDIFDFGYNSNAVEITEYNFGRKLTDFSRAYMERECYMRSNEVMVRDHGDYYILELNMFTLQTRELFEYALREIKRDVPVFLDISCNTGGLLIGALDVIPYLTNDSFDIQYYNPLTEEVYVEEYKSIMDVTMKNPVYVITSEVTYSAGNLLASIIKDEDIAPIYGRKTSGGAGALGFTILPNNLTMSFSSNLVFRDSNEVIIENGIDPDVKLSGNWDTDTVFDNIVGTYTDNFDLTVTDLSSIHYLDLLVESTNKTDDVDSISYTLVLMDPVSREVQYTEEFDGNTFAIEDSLFVAKNELLISVIADYVINGDSYTLEVYRAYLDDHPNFLTPHAELIEVDEVVSGSNHDYQDVDVFQIDIPMLGMYEFIYNGESKAYWTLFDEEGNEIDSWTRVTLDEGRYYIMLDRNDANYQFKVMYRYDDNPVDKEVHFTEGMNPVSVTFDFHGDRENIRFTLDQESYVSVHFEEGVYISSDMYFADENGVKLNALSDNLFYLSMEGPYVLPKGEYVFGFHRDMIGTYHFEFEVEPILNDVDGDLDLENGIYQVMELGTNTFTFDGLWDVDIFVFETDKALDVMYQTNDNVSVLLITENGYEQLYNELLHIEPGTHYFRVSAHQTTAPLVLEFNFQSMTDESDPFNMIPITIGESFMVIIEEDNDVDYYTFSVAEPLRLQFSIEDGHPSEMRIKTIDGDELKTIHYGFGIVYLAPGDYILEVGEFISNATEVFHFLTTVTVFETNDEAPDIGGLDASYYTVLTLPDNQHTQISGRLDYERDSDVYMLNITQAGNYKLGFSGDVRGWVFNEAGFSESYNRNNSSVYLEVGVYYLSIYNSSGYYDRDYTFTFFYSQ